MRTLPIPVALALLLAAPASAQTEAPSAPAVAPAEKPVPRTVPVVLHTSAGDITIALEVERAPLTSANFLRYVDQKRFDGTVFYRAFTFEQFPDIGLIQGGARNDPKRILKPVRLEPTSLTGLSHTDGVVSMARGAPDSATGDFSIMLGDMRGLDANPSGPGDNLGYAAFGKVVAGMEVVRAIAAAPRDPAKGEGVMKGQMLAAPVRIISARRAPTPPQ